MRYIPKVFLFLLLLAGLSTFSGCGDGQAEPTPEEMLTGSWKFKNFSQNGQAAPIQIMVQSSFNFSKDGRYEILMGDVERGVWKLSEDKKVLITTADGMNFTNEIDIVKLTPELVILANNMSTNKVRMELVPDK